MTVAVSENFEKMTKKAIFSIIVFIIVYFILLVFAIGITVLCFYVGIAIIFAFPHIMTIVIGLGIIGMGVFILIFLLKFLFKKHAIDRSHLIEIKRKDEPKLFAFIDDIVQEVQTDFPKKIYLSADVNASVFYDSSFWSMFFPIKKNLLIGMGLINTVSEVEFKAILAHEFGHFSQKSMKVGSYVYNVNQIIFNMLEDNVSFQKLIELWTGISSLFGFFIAIGLKIIYFIQFILRKMYAFVNVNYMGLSREMEFHADEVAANVAGIEPLKTSLLRLDLASFSYNCVINYYESKIHENFKGRNIFKDQFEVMQHFGKDYKLEFENKLPIVSLFDFKKYNKSKLIVDDQWASHPSIEDRIAALEKLNISKNNTNNNFAIDLFANPVLIQEKTTDKLFSTIQYTGDVIQVDSKKFTTEFLEDLNKNSFPKVYNAYYDNKNPIPFDLNTEKVSTKVKDFDDLFGKEKIELVYEYNSLVSDIESLEQIAKPEVYIKTFDYDGKKYKKAECLKLIDIIKIEKVRLEEIIAQNDKDIYAYFHELASLQYKTDDLKNVYIELFETDTAFNEKIKLPHEIMEDLSFLQVVTPFETIRDNFSNLKMKEKALKSELSAIINHSNLFAELDKKSQEAIEKYLSKDLTYFYTEEFNNSNLDTLSIALDSYQFLLNRKYFFAKQKLLVFQESLLN